MSEELEKIELLNILMGGKSFDDCLKERGIYGSFVIEGNYMTRSEATILMKMFLESSSEDYEYREKVLIIKEFINRLREFERD